MGKIYRNALPDLPDIIKRANPRLTRLEPTEIQASQNSANEDTLDPSSQQTLEELLLASKPEAAHSPESASAPTSTTLPPPAPTPEPALKQTPEPKPQPILTKKQLKAAAAEKRATRQASEAQAAAATPAGVTAGQAPEAPLVPEAAEGAEGALQADAPDMPLIEPPKPVKPPEARKPRKQYLRIASHRISTWRHRVTLPRAPRWRVSRLAIPAVQARSLLTVAALCLIPAGVIATQSTLYVQPMAGAYLNAALLAFLTGIALWQARYRALCIVVSLIPLGTMVMLSLPGTTAFTRTATLYGFLLVFGLIYRHLLVFGAATEEQDTTGSGRLGLRGYSRQLPTMIVAGQLLGVIGYGLLRSHYAFHDTLTPVVAASAVIFALAEEIVFRGLIQQQAMQVMRPLLAGMFATSIFAAATVGQGLPWYPLFAILLGSALSYIYARKPNILLTWVVNVACKLTFLGLLSAIS